MRNDQITYMPLSNKKKEGYYAQSKVDTSLKGDIKHLTGQNARVVDNKLYSTITDPFTIDPKEPQKALDRFLKDR
ncbi:two-component system regulatory protein YycI, partial [Streptomyces sp. S9]|nr:two-component system regulatory protein YycI [Streptomyces sp. S9]